MRRWVHGLFLASAACGAAAPGSSDPTDGTTPTADTGHPQTTPTGDTAATPPEDCTQVIGYSQVGLPAGGWFNAGGVFESLVDDDRWQLLWNSGGGVDLWQDPAYAGWSRPLQSACVDGSETPHRVLLSVSGPYGDDEAAWAAAIEATVTTVLAELPSVEQVVLQPVVGGPGHETCTFDGEPVRASWQHAHIDAAIAEVVKTSAHPVVAGASPEVDACDDYRDATGHLTPDAARAVAQRLGEHYAE